MVRSGAPEPAGGDQSLGELVSLAARDISQLVRSEINLAKTELRADVRRVALGGALAAIAAFFGALILLCLCFAWAYGLHAMGVWGGMYGAFLFAALTFFLLGVVTGVVAWLIVRHMSRMKKTRESVTEGLGMLRRDGKGDDDGRKGRKGLKGRKAQPDKDLTGPSNGRSRVSLRPGGKRGEPSALPDGSLPDGSLPEGSLPEGSLPDGQLPEIADPSPR
jgi:hypothetical protein